jgi:hypothetical protein
VELTVATTSFALGTSATASATVAGNTLDLNWAAAGTSVDFTWDDEVLNYIAWESYQDVSSIDNVAISTIPEPATMGLMGIVFAGILFMRRRFMK